MKINLNIIKKHKYKNLLVLIGLLILLVLILSLSYAYFTPNKGSNSAATPGSVTGGSTDRLLFAEGEELSMTPGSQNLNENTGNYSVSTNPTATLFATDESVGSIAYYNVTFYIGYNTYKYSTGNLETPELLLTVTDPAGNEITEIDGLTYVTQNGVSGFDITEINVNYFNVSSNYKIESYKNSGKIDEWNFKVTMVNLNTSQNINRDASLQIRIIMHEETFDQDIYSTILKNNGGVDYINEKGIPNFQESLATNDGLYATQDNYGTSYYFRGAVDNNWILFAGYYWRIVRLNGDESIRLQFAGSVPPTELTKVIKTGSDISLGSTKLNYNYNIPELGGYMYELGNQHGYAHSSMVKDIVDLWYEENIVNTEFHEYIADTLYCVDRVAYADRTGITLDPGVGTNTRYFGSHVRIYTKKPSLVCETKEDSFTVADEINGNGALMYPIALITTDEIMMSGNNKTSFINNGMDYWTLSPSDFYYFNGQRVHMYAFTAGSSIYARTFSDGPYNVVPMLSLKPSALTKGSGTWNDPYVII